ncbi:phenylalanine--tRNA ligase subunit alpha [Candidatus Woesebacteria bacterium RIFCSPLOWO2_01_FULL_39_61]|uniref:Phenylalanine--tRNA ligase alpha subunit n=1 Tax=Candidatus Woesebacteria bacterium RIFCSPHIGHO2_02_FULL_39_13 TaxID=1802505 RepID=A0A1F7Z3U7_9BACT|nr:MAG: phenylalanine--tRNA ligase subunit alpha [Candidatus Woesebacteria bacterium RIFCSPHIGHO2_01_FULL_39_95]OGM34292.1 MAG: phenylalanine--tRNA ligase subunit alpha [Candidatus Woesebacteria bacterium RIFCSPHIGHO2_02_FULL_39_13]OGM39074.1 MAG: phenylalanine--tRNA ligase subunit alpha [Candidatus Woesebacteria bacterium RIFCSPHIGHO2_12_FULL_40_20]OGM68629.1 MAG: phenylalanine--tRNA ligase subunit alpha [Candidatus Woesebacteria bacterium RIFCSPLOWO2_01_FULL_39_61]OGM73720.1 MAG: phenylalanin
MREEILNLKNEALAQIMDVVSFDDLENLKISYLGRKGKINDFIKKIGELPQTDKKEIGNLINDSKKVIEVTLAKKKEGLTSSLLSKKEWFDLTIPGNKTSAGHFHPQTTVLNEILDIFKYLGYQIADGPEIEKDYYNFEVLNFPPEHPARDAQQTMFFDVSNTSFKEGQVIPRTHTSAMQGRVMEASKPPLRVIVPGRCFRYEQVDASHGVEFWQVEGFVVDKAVHLTDLFGTIEFVLKSLFGQSAKIKFATTFFPFVEPGVDAYLECTVCDGRGCTFCKQTGWSEIMPAGMIHPNVLSKSKIDSKIWNGFAFAIGLSRVVSLRYQIDDLRVLHTPDLRILKQF